MSLNALRGVVTTVKELVRRAVQGVVPRVQANVRDVPGDVRGHAPEPVVVVVNLGVAVIVKEAVAENVVVVLGVLGIVLVVVLKVVVMLVLVVIPDVLPGAVLIVLEIVFRLVLFNVGQCV